MTDGPGGDSALVVADGTARLVNQNDCRLHDPRALTRHGPVDMQWLQYSGAIWYPMVYDLPDDERRELAAAKVESQFARAMRYVEAVGARVVVPSAGPPCFLDPELAGLNVVTGDEISIFPDATAFLERLAKEGIETGVLVDPGYRLDVETGDGRRPPSRCPTTTWPPSSPTRRPTLRATTTTGPRWLAAEKASWPPPRPDLAGRLAAWWEPLLATRAVAAGGDRRRRPDPLRRRGRATSTSPPARCGRTPASRTRSPSTCPGRSSSGSWPTRAVDWSNSLFLSCGSGPGGRASSTSTSTTSSSRCPPSASPGPTPRRRPEAPAAGGDGAGEEIELCGYVMERYCPHRRADLAIFGEVDGGVLTCALHGWQFDLETGRCLTADDRRLRVRRADTPS